MNTTGTGMRDVITPTEVIIMYGKPYLKAALHRTEWGMPAGACITRGKTSVYREQVYIEKKNIPMMLYRFKWR